MSCDGQVVEHQLEPKAGVATVTTTSAQTSKMDEAPLELATQPLTQWNLQRSVYIYGFIISYLKIKATMLHDILFKLLKNIIEDLPVICI